MSLKDRIIKNPIAIDDFAAGQSIFYEGENSWLGLHPSRCCLLMTVNGRGEISFGGETVVAERGTIVYFPPNHPHYFHRREYWNLLWFQFYARPSFPQSFTWNQPVKGMFWLKLESKNLRRCIAGLNEILQLDMQRGNGWYDLALNLIEGVLLRCNNLAGSSKSSFNEKIMNAQKILSDPANNLNIDALAESCEMSRVTFYNSFKKAVGLSPRKYRELCLMRYGQSLLETSNLSVSDIADKLGMQNVYYFSNRFKKFSGLPPSIYREKKKS